MSTCIVIAQSGLLSWISRQGTATAAAFFETDTSISPYFVSSEAFCLERRKISEKILCAFGRAAVGGSS